MEYKTLENSIRQLMMEVTKPNNTKEREKIENVARPDDDPKTSKEKTSKQAEIKQKIVGENEQMALKNYLGLSDELIAAVAKVVNESKEKEKEKEEKSKDKEPDNDKDTKSDSDDKDNDKDNKKKGGKKTKEDSQDAKKVTGGTTPVDVDPKLKPANEETIDEAHKNNITGHHTVIEKHGYELKNYSEPLKKFTYVHPKLGHTIEKGATHFKPEKSSGYYITLTHKKHGKVFHSETGTSAEELDKHIKKMHEMNNNVNEEHLGFKKLEKKIAAKGDVSDPDAVAAEIGMKKYGKKKFEKMAHAGKEHHKEEVGFSDEELAKIEELAKAAGLELDEAVAHDEEVHSVLKKNGYKPHKTQPNMWEKEHNNSKYHMSFYPERDELQLTHISPKNLHHLRLNTGIGHKNLDHMIKSFHNRPDQE